MGSFLICLFMYFSLHLHRLGEKTILSFPLSSSCIFFLLHRHTFIPFLLPPPPLAPYLLPPSLLVPLPPSPLTCLFPLYKKKDLLTAKLYYSLVNQNSLVNCFSIYKHHDLVIFLFFLFLLFIFFLLIPLLILLLLPPPSPPRKIFFISIIFGKVLITEYCYIFFNKF